MCNVNILSHDTVILPRGKTLVTVEIAALGLLQSLHCDFMHGANTIGQFHHNSIRFWRSSSWQRTIETACYQRTHLNDCSHDSSSVTAFNWPRPCKRHLAEAAMRETEQFWTYQLYPYIRKSLFQSPQLNDAAGSRWGVNADVLQCVASQRASMAPLDWRSNISSHSSMIDKNGQQLSCNTFNFDFMKFFRFQHRNFRRFFSIFLLVVNHISMHHICQHLRVKK